MHTDLREQVALVTGGGRGIGRAICHRLAVAGCRVAAVARTESQLVETAAAVPAGSDREPIFPIVADVRRDEDLQRAVDVVTHRWGPIQILVNNAGFATPRRPVARGNLSDWDQTLATCLRAPMVLTRLVIENMIAQRSGCIVNIASIAAKRGRAGEAAYAAAKFGLLGFTQALRDEVRGSGVKVTAICPGVVDTTFIPNNARVDRRAFLQPNDIAEVVLHVVSSLPHVCPAEIVIEPQRDPEKN